MKKILLLISVLGTTHSILSAQHGICDTNTVDCHPERDICYPYQKVKKKETDKYIIYDGVAAMGKQSSNTTHGIELCFPAMKFDTLIVKKVVNLNDKSKLFNLYSKVGTNTVEYPGKIQITFYATTEDTTVCEYDCVILKYKIRFLKQ